jgi:NAD(P)-dependent dehydrogenase (short-subunit alcohol dehydrogenase family)
MRSCKRHGGPANMKHNRIVITGGGSGLGRALALEYARARWRVAVLDCNSASAVTVASEVDHAGGKAVAVECDITDAASVARAATEIRRRWRGLDVLVNNAGIAGSGTVVDTPEADWRRIMEVNLFGAVAMCRAFLPGMIRAGAGHVVNISSAAGFVSAPGMAAYNASKAALISLSESLRFELAPQGIGVSVVCPSFFRTNLLDKFLGSEGSRQMALSLMDRSPLSADDVARSIRRGIQRKEFLMVPHGDAWRTLVLKRLAPELFFRLVGKRTASMHMAQTSRG